MENKTAKGRIILGGRLIDSQLNFLFSQKISVREGNFNQKSKNLFKNLAVILNLFQHLTNKHRLTQNLCLLQSNGDGQVLKRVQHDKSLMFGCVVLRDNDDKQLNKLINQEPENNAKIKPSCRSYRYRRQERSSSRTRQVCSQLVFSASVKKLRACYFGIYPIINISKGFNTFNLSVHFLLFWTCDAKKKKTEPKEEKTAPTLRPNRKSVLFLFKKETGCAFYGVRGRCAPPEPP